MDYKDYYQVLGVPEDADQKAIKKRYRELARQYHPDMNPDNPDAEAKFKEINEAYEVLGDADKRAKYNELRHSYQQWQRMGGRPGGSGGFDFSQWMAGGAPSGGMRVEYADLGGMGGFSDFFEAIFGGMGTNTGAAGGIDLEELFGGGRRGGRTSQRVRRGRDLDTQVRISLEEAYHGTMRMISKDGRRLQVKIPAGARTGTKVRISGEGEPGAGATAGDLYLHVDVAPDDRFERRGDDLYIDVTFDLYTLILGGEVDIPTMIGTVTLKIKPGTQPGQLIRVRGKGMPQLKGDDYGDLYVRVQVALPEELNAKERALFKELASMRGHGYDHHD